MLSLEAKDKELYKEIEFLSQTRLRDCYQCGECTAGCPVAFAMEPPPNQAIRLLQLGYTSEVLNSTGIWLCASCNVCGDRCPRGISYAKIADVLRTLNQRNKIATLTLEKIPKTYINELPQQAFIAAFRKLTT
jgi:heterodisulfide reductase subunit C